MSSINFNRYLMIGVVLLNTLFVTACSHSGIPGSGTGSLDMNPITLDNAGELPIFSTMPSSSIIHVHNNTDHTISNISYTFQDSNSNSKLAAVPETRYSSTASNCSTIKAGQSCPLSFTTMTPNSKDFRGSIAITASYVDNKKDYSYSTLINYRQVPQQANGVVAISGVNLAPLPGHSAYGVIYVYGSGQGKIYTVKSMAPDKEAIKITQGNIVGLQVPSNMIQAVEIMSPTLVQNKVKSVPNKTSFGFNLLIKSMANDGSESAYSFDIPNSVSVSPQNDGALIVAGNAPVLNISNSATGQVHLYNAGNTNATGISYAPGIGINIIENTCQTIMTPHSNCSITFSIISGDRSGNSNINVTYSNGLTSSSDVAISWYSSGGPLLGIGALPASFSFNASQTESAQVTVTNLGAVPISNVLVPAPSIISGNGTIAIEQSGNTCTGATLQIGETCNYIVSMTANAATSGSANIGISGSYNSGNSYTRFSNVVYIVNPYQAILAVSPISNFTIVGDNLSTAVNTVTTTNVGSAPATVTSDSIINTTGYFTSLSGGSCSSPIMPGNSCSTRTITLGPINSTSESIVSVMGTPTSYAYNIQYSGGTQGLTIASANLNATISPNANLAISQFTASGTSSGDGTSASPYTFSGANPAGNIIATYKNTGSVPIVITGVTDTNSGFLWTIDPSSTCYLAGGIPGATLNPNDTCTIKYNSVIATNYLGLGNIGAVYSENVVLPQITFLTPTGKVLFQLTPQTASGSSKIYANSTQATLTNVIVESGTIASGGTITITNTVANAAGYTSIPVTTTMEDYFTGVSSITNCTQSTGSGGIRTQSCTLSNSAGLSGIGIYNIGSYVPVGTVLHANFTIGSGVFVAPNILSTSTTLN